jgi:hypothetical protein
VQDIAYGIVATIGTIILGLVLAGFIPVQIDGTNSLDSSTSSKGEVRRYTMEELDKAAKEMDEKRRRLITEFKKKSALERYVFARQGGEYLTFFPWILLPIIVRLKEFMRGVFAVAPLGIAALLQLILPVEFVTSAFGLLCGIVLMNCIAYMKKNSSS